MKLTPSMYEPLFVSVTEHVTVNTLYDVRRVKKDGTYPVYIRVCCRHDKLYLPTGISLTPEDYAKALIVKTGSTKICKAKAQVGQVFKKVNDAVDSLNAENNFTFENLKNILAGPQKTQPKSVTLLEYWMEFGESKNTEKTREQYLNALKSFYRFLGCTVTCHIKRRSKERVFTVKGKKAKVTPSFVNETIIKQWDASMDEAGLSISTRSIYLRALRAVMNNLGQNNVISKTPKFSIKSGTRRKEDFIPVSDIVKIRDYKKREGKKAADWWLILYLCNGSNLKDLAYLEWNDDYFYNNELTYIRGKIADKVQVTVHIPVTEPLKKLLEKYASKPEKGKLVFPQILLSAKHDSDMESRIHDFNRQIRKGMKGVCEHLGIRPVTASTARNSYITTLTWHGIQDAFIDAMVGHVDSKNVLRGYQGTISPKKRLKVNNLLFIDPEIDEDEE
ncbi:MAG: tyrosine-type recombinase/integrase [Bacteroidales bacterium]|nr:tyrosine-type recombinase/integrase [Bacteroidales bacterium]MBR6227837.1 tyrosine-type recombinase/integrase [Bacteroidales bacterium]